MNQKNMRFGNFCSHLMSTMVMGLLLVGYVKGQCQRPPSKPGLELTDESAAMDSFPEGSSVTLKCVKGYSKASGDGQIFCQNGEWTTETLQCQKKSCGSPGELLNGKFTTPEGTEFGATAYAFCNRGFRLFGTAYRQCFDFGWNNRVPTCEIVKCEDPPTIVNGRISSQPSKEFPEFRDVIQYTCNRNFNLVGDSQLVCNEDGKYNGTTPECKELNCPPPNIANAVRIEGGPPPYKLKYYVVYKCIDGYKMEGEDKLVCETSGWSSEYPSCSKVKCPAPPIISNGKVFIQLNKEFPEFGDIIQYTCEENYNLVGDSRLQCNKDGTYSGKIPECKAIPTARPSTAPPTRKTTTPKPKSDKPEEKPDHTAQNVGIGVGVALGVLALVVGAFCARKVMKNKGRGVPPVY